MQPILPPLRTRAGHALRPALAFAAPLALALATPAIAAPAAAPAGKPNLLFILAEDIGPDLGCYGTPLVRTPHLDALAARGVRHTRAFTTSPVCSPSRSAIMTGMYQTTIGAHHHRTWAWNKQPLPAGVRTIADQFRQAGYFTANLSARPGKAKKDPVTGMRITGADGSGKTDFNFVVEKPFDGHSWSQRAPGQPFFAQITIMESHKGDGWTLARSPESPVRHHVDANQVRLPPYTPDHPIAREEYANYLDAVGLMDAYVGEVLARLERDGLAQNTIVVFLGDNGQCLFRSKQFLYDGGIHVPLLIAWPDRRRAGTVDDRLVSAIDVSAALLGLAGIRPAPAMQGRDFLAPGAARRTHVFAARDRMDASIDRMRAVRTERFKYIRNYLPAIPYMQHNAYKERSYPTWNLVKELAARGELRPEAAAFAAPTKPIEELYDLTADPHEVRNLAADPAHASTLRELRALVDGWVRETDRGDRYEDPVDIFRGYNGRLPDEPAAPKGAEP